MATRFTIRCNGMIMGTYPGTTDAEALESCHRDYGYASFADACAKRGMTRDNYKCEDPGPVTAPAPPPPPV